MKGCPATSARTERSWFTWSTCFSLTTAIVSALVPRDGVPFIQDQPSTFLKTFSANTLFLSGSIALRNLTNQTRANVPMETVSDQVHCTLSTKYVQTSPQCFYQLEVVHRQFPRVYTNAFLVSRSFGFLDWRNWLSLIGSIASFILNR